MARDMTYQPLVLVDTAELARPEWLEYRRKGLGGSDAAAVLNISPFRTARDLYYDKLGIVTADDQANWVALEVGNLLEPLVARIFEKKTGLKIYRWKCMFQHPRCPWMIADLDYLVDLPDGTTAILEIKTTNYNAKDKWWHSGKEIVPAYYEAQGRHYMAVMNLDRVYYCCLYGNNEEEVIIRRIDRDMDYEMELIALEQDFWENRVLAKCPPPYWEDDGSLILESVRRVLGPADKDVPPAVLSKAQSENVAHFLKLQEEKSQVDARSQQIKNEMDRLKALIMEEMGSSRSAVTGDGCTVSWTTVRKPGIYKESLERMKAVQPEIYAEYATVSESQRFYVKRPELAAA